MKKLIAGFALSGVLLVACDNGETPEVEKTGEVAENTSEETSVGRSLIVKDSVEETVKRVADYVDEDIPEPTIETIDARNIDTYQFGEEAVVQSIHSSDEVYGIVIVARSEEKLREVLNDFDLPITAQIEKLLEEDLPGETYEVVDGGFGFNITVLYPKINDSEGVYSLTVIPGK